jgi:hypothetical protein
LQLLLDHLDPKIITVSEAMALRYVQHYLFYRKQVIHILKAGPRTNTLAFLPTDITEKILGLIHVDEFKTYQKYTAIADNIQMRVASFDRKLEILNLANSLPIITDTAINFIRTVMEPNMYNAAKVALGATQYYSIRNGVNYYAITSCAVSIGISAIYAEFANIHKSLFITVGYMEMPHHSSTHEVALFWLYMWHSSLSLHGY